MKRLILLVAAAAVFLAASACGRSWRAGETVTEEQSSSDAVSETESETETESAVPEALDEEGMKKLIADKTTDSIISFVYDDFDKDGIYDAFALTGIKRADVKDRPYTALYAGELWFINFTGIKKLVDWGDYWKVGNVLDVGESKLYSVEKYSGTGSVSLVWSVDGPSVKEEAVSGKVGEIAAASAKDITAFSLYYDDSAGKGYIRVKYFFSYDKGIKEYGGIKVTLKELYTYDGAEDMIKDIEEGGMNVADIYYRSNGVVTVNCRPKIEGAGNLSSMVFVVSGNELKPAAPEENIGRGSSSTGIYKAALFPDIASYPKDFPTIKTTTTSTTAATTTATTTEPTTTTTTTTTTKPTTTTTTTAPSTEPETTETETDSQD